jgi:nucleotide-binding universal stress UspA family protein
MTRIVVGYDGSPTSTTALTWSVGEARLRGAELVAVTVVDDRVPASRVDEVREQMQPTFASLTDGVPAVHRIERGDAAAQLVDTCNPDDLLVVGSRGRGALVGRLLGSVCHASLHAAPCPVVVIHEEPARTHGVVLVGVDGSAGSHAALAVGSEEARLRGAAVHVVHAVHWDTIGEEWITPSADDLISWGKSLLEKALVDAERPARAEVVPGRAADVLVQRSEEADLLVVGSRGRSPLASLLLGSTAEACTRRAQCPVLVVRAS